MLSERPNMAPPDLAPNIQPACMCSTEYVKQKQSKSKSKAEAKATQRNARQSKAARGESRQELWGAPKQAAGTLGAQAGVTAQAKWTSRRADEQTSRHGAKQNKTEQNKT